MKKAVLILMTVLLSSANAAELDPVSFCVQRNPEGYHFHVNTYTQHGILLMHFISLQPDGRTMQDETFWVKRTERGLESLLEDQGSIKGMSFLRDEKGGYQLVIAGGFRGGHYFFPGECR